MLNVMQVQLQQTARKLLKHMRLYDSGFNAGQRRTPQHLPVGNMVSAVHPEDLVDATTMETVYTYTHTHTHIHTYTHTHAHTHTYTHIHTHAHT